MNVGSCVLKLSEIINLLDQTKPLDRKSKAVTDPTKFHEIAFWVTVGARGVLSLRGSLEVVVALLSCTILW